jgi:Na+-transporting NADH:ubiquinone oxidoreductase subunit D
MSRFRERLAAPLIDDNPITVQILGLCSALAVSNSLRPALIMAVCVLAVLVFSNAAISLLRHVMPTRIRLILEVTLIASAVIVVDETLLAFAPDVSRVLSVFVGLIITNCIVLGRAEAFALHNPVVPSIGDALGNGLGYAGILVSVAFVRELGGTGAVMGRAVLPADYPGNEMMLYAPSAFFIIGLIIWGLRAWRTSRSGAAARAADAVSYPEVG